MDRLESGKRFKVKWGAPLEFVPILPHAEFGPNDHQEDVFHFIKQED